jgi:chemotaxis protein CheD
MRDAPRLRVTVSMRNAIGEWLHLRNGHRMSCNGRKGPLVKVGMAQLRVGSAPMKMLTMALGSCLALVLYDEGSRVGGLAHAMHPWRSGVKSNANRAKFVDSAITLMVDRMAKRGAQKERLIAKIFGGAKMFDHVKGSRCVLQIGERNVAAARTELRRIGIPIVAECVGGSKGRTILFDVSSGTVIVKDAYDNEEIF